MELFTITNRKRKLNQVSIHDILPRVNAGVSRYRVGILGFAVHDLFSRGESTLATVEQVDRWLCHPAVIPLSPITGEIREYLSSDILGPVNVGVGDGTSAVTDVQPAFDALISVLRPTGGIRL